MKLNNYMNESGNSKSRASDQASSHEYTRSYTMPKDVHEHSRTHPMLAESTTEAKEKDVTVGSYTNIGLLKTVLKTVHDEASANKTYTNNSVQCNTRDRLPNQNQKKDNLDDQLDMSKKIRTLFEKMNEKLSSHCTYDVCNSSKTLVQTNTGMRKGCLSPIVTSRKDNSSNRTMSLKNSAPKKFNCNKFTQNGPKLSENNCAKPRKVCSKKLTLYCDPQCQKLKKKIENIHKGHAEREPFYSFCGKMRQRSKMSHPLLDRKCRSRTKAPHFGNKTAIIKTLDSTKISIKANTLVINCTKENYPNVLNKIKMMELSLTGTDTTHVSDGNGKDDGNGMDDGNDMDGEK